MTAFVSAVLRAGMALLLVGAAGCSTLPADVARPVSTTRVAPPSSPLAEVLTAADIPPGRSGFRPLPDSSFALDARLELIKRAQVSLDLQYYFIGNDEVGRTILRGLADAAQRGVKVRLLIDDLHTEDLEDLLVGLAAFDNVEVRLFNPFVYGRGSSVARAWNFITDFRRLNHRMHNKLFVADGVLAIAGGRNLADEYFLRAVDANFIDFDLLMAGAVVPEASKVFDQYWNSEQVFPIEALMANRPAADVSRTRFDRLTPADALLSPRPMVESDLFGAPALGVELDLRWFHFVVADAAVYADTPSKNTAVTDPATGISAQPTSATAHLLALMHQAHEEIFLVSPYFIPGKEGMKGIQAAHERGAVVRIVTNSLAASDAPLVTFRYASYRVEMLQAGAHLYELSSSRFRMMALAKRVLGKSSARLHAKIGVIDHKTLIVGSVNMDPRSARINTEIGIAIDSPQLAGMMLGLISVSVSPGFYEVRLRPDGGLRWVARDGVNEEQLDDEPESSLFDRFGLYMKSLFVPEDQL